jgi:toxin ParE1/3/4
VRLVWSAAAEADLDDIVRYVAYDNLTAALHLDARICQSVERLQALPQSGRVGFAPGTRELVVRGTPYLVTYEVGADAVIILHVTHGRRQWPLGQ